MRLVEALRSDGRAPRFDVASGQLHRDLPGLSEVPQVGTAADADLVIGEALGRERCAGQRFEAPQVRIDGGVVETIVALDKRLHVVVLEVDREQPEGGHVPR